MDNVMMDGQIEKWPCSGQIESEMDWLIVRVKSANHMTNQDIVWTV